jgi:hypothetical protein
MTSSNLFAPALRRAAAGLALLLGAFALSACGGGGSSGGTTSGSGGTVAQQIANCEAGLASTPEISANQMNYVVDSGPCAYFVPYNSPAGTAASVQQVGAFNAPFTSVTVCVPNTSNCATIDHVLIDTGSSGLRLMASVLPSTLALPAVTANNEQLYECVQFASGFSWGSVRAADVKIAGESTSNLAPLGISVHVIGDSESITLPSGCSAGYTTTTPQDTVASFGANGILGVGLFLQDCGANCTVNAGQYNIYYNCPTTNCTNNLSVAVTTQQVSNPVSFFLNDSNGVILQTNPDSSSTGGMGAVSGVLTFGVNTGTNNLLTGTPAVYTADANGNLSSWVTAVGSTSVLASNSINAYYYYSFLDSGSNAVYFPISSSTGTPPVTSPAIATDSNGWFIPGSNTLVQGYIASGGAAVMGTSNISYSIGNADTLFNLNNGQDAAFLGLAAPNTISGLNNSGIDWGFPFFFGRSISVVIEGNSVIIPAVTGTTYSSGRLWSY